MIGYGIKLEDGLHSKVFPAIIPTGDELWDMAVGAPYPAHVETFNAKNGQIHGDYIQTHMDNDGKILQTTTSNYTMGHKNSSKTVMASGAVSFHFYDEMGEFHGDSQRTLDGFRCGNGETIPYQETMLCKFDHGKPIGLIVKYYTYGSENVYFYGKGKEKETAAVEEELALLQFQDNSNTELGFDKRSAVQQMEDRAQFLYKKYNCDM